MVEKLFLVLDLDSTLNLATVMDREILQKSLASKAWKALLYHRYPSSSFPYWWDGITLTDELTDMIVAAQTFAAILKLIKKPRVLLLDLLHAICESYPTHTQHPNEKDNVQLVCRQHTDSPHNILGWGLLLLEEVEATLGTTEQSIQSIEIKTLRGPILAAIHSRMSRQLEEVTSVSITCVDLENTKSAQAFYTLMQAKPFGLCYLKVHGPIGRDGWEMVSKAMELETERQSFVQTCKAGLTEGRKEDLRAIWEAADTFWICKTFEGVREGLVDVVIVDKYPRGGWDRLEQIMDMTQDEFQAELLKQYEYDDSDEEADGEIGEEEDGEAEEESGEEIDYEEAEETEERGEEEDEEKGDLDEQEDEEAEEEGEDQIQDK